MELRGERECRDCEARWSYYETGSVACPACGSRRSVAVGDGAVHTGESATLDLESARAAVDAEPIDRVASLAAEAARDYRHETGFVVGGDLRPLTEEYLLAAEIETVGSRLSRELQVPDAAEHYLSTLLRAPTDDRPGPDAIPEVLRAERGLAVSRAVGDYRRDLRAYVDRVDGDLASALSAIRARRKRIDALDGGVDPRTAERIVAAIRDVHAYLEREDEAALARIEERLRDER